MPEDERRFVWVKDEEGNEYVCQKRDVGDPNAISLADLTTCLESAAEIEGLEDRIDL